MLERMAERDGPEHELLLGKHTLFESVLSSVFIEPNECNGTSVALFLHLGKCRQPFGLQSRSLLTPPMLPWEIEHAKKGT